MMRYRAIRKGGSLKMSDAAGVSPSHHSASCTGLLAFSLYISVCEQTKLEGDSVPWEAGTEGGHSNTLGLRARPSNSIGTRAELTHISHPKHLGSAICLHSQVVLPAGIGPSCLDSCCELCYRYSKEMSATWSQSPSSAWSSCWFIIALGSAGFIFSNCRHHT